MGVKIPASDNRLNKLQTSSSLFYKIKIILKFEYKEEFGSQISAADTDITALWDFPRRWLILTIALLQVFPPLIPLNCSIKQNKITNLLKKTFESMDYLYQWNKTRMHAHTHKAKQKSKQTDRQTSCLWISHVQTKWKEKHS